MEDKALTASVNWLLERQAPAGWWTDELETNVTMTAEHVLLLRFLALPLDAVRVGAIRHMLHHQREDGSWALYYEGPADLSTTIEAYVALKVLGLDPSRDEMRRALATIRRLGGLAHARVFTKIWMALFGNYPWSGIPTMPPEIVYFPPSMPFNLYDFACWARGTVGPLCVVIARRPRRELGVNVGEIVNPGTEASMQHVPGSGWLWWVDQLLKLYERLPYKPGRNAACAKMIDWVVARQEADGSWGGIQPPWVYSLIALDLEGYGSDHPVMRKGLRGMERFAVSDDTGWRFQACMSPVWDTAWAIRALYQAGLRADHPAMRRAVDWMLAEQIPANAPGDWQVRCKGEPGGGWAFEFDNDIYPDIDDTAVIVCSLLEGGEGSAVRASIDRAVRWTLAMRSSNGAWASFDRDNTSEILYRMPFSDFGAMIDPPTEDVTAHVLEMLAMLGRDERDPYVASGLKYLRETQKPRGHWFGRWGVNHIYGTWCVGFGARAAARGARHGRACNRVDDRHAKQRRRMGRELPFIHGRIVRRHRHEHGLADCMGDHDVAVGGAGRTSRRAARASIFARAPAIGRNLGRALFHRHRLSARLLSELPHVPASLSGHGTGDGGSAPLGKGGISAGSQHLTVS